MVSVVVVRIRASATIFGLTYSIFADLKLLNATSAKPA
jgi:hypothetical protein